MRLYTIYAQWRGGGFSTKSVNYSHGTHRWIYEVYAASIKQAYYLAGREQFAAGARAVGVRRIERDWWHHGSAPGPGDRELAPYLVTQ